MEISTSQKCELLEILEKRFYENLNRHPSISWEKIETKLKSDNLLLSKIFQLEISSGEPDVITLSDGQNYYIDCSIESLKERRSFCYDEDALNSRKANKPQNSVMALVSKWDVILLDEKDYFDLQRIISVDLKTSSWLLTPVSVRKNGGAIFGDNRFGRVFIYHNGADSYYAARGFRCKVLIS